MRIRSSLPRRTRLWCLGAVLGLAGCEAIDRLYETEYTTTLHFGGDADSRPSSGPTSAPSSAPQTVPNRRS